MSGLDVRLSGRDLRPAPKRVRMTPEEIWFPRCHNCRGEMRSAWPWQWYCRTCLGYDSKGEE